MRGNFLKRIAVVVVAVCVGVTFIPLTGEYAVFAEEGTSVAAQDVSTGDNGQQQGTESGDNNGLEASGDTGENGGGSGEPDTQTPGTETPGTQTPGTDGNGSGDGGTQDPPTTDPSVKNGLVNGEDGSLYYYIDDVPQTGLQTVDGKTYYFDPENDHAALSGFQTVEKKTYYFDQETYAAFTGYQTIGENKYYFNDEGVMQKGFQTVDGKKLYFKATGPADGTLGQQLTGLLYINNNYYYFNEDMKKGFQTIKSGKYAGKVLYFKATGDTAGIMLKGLLTVSGYKYYQNPDRKTGFVKVGKYVYYFLSDGKAYTGKGWISNKTRYANGNGTVANGVKYIDGKYYLFDAKTGVKKTAKGFYTQSGRTYYVTASGVVARGWTAIGDKAYYFYKSGAAVGGQAKNTTIGYLKIPASGYLGEAYALGIKKLNKTKWTLRQAYKNSYKIRYQGRWWRQKTSELYAIKGFKKNKGNCYVMAATFYIQAKLLGYNVRQIHGKVAYRAPHSWTQIKNSKGKWRVYDPNFRNETGRNGWNIYYGKKGTWRYTNYSVFQN